MVRRGVAAVAFVALLAVGGASAALLTGSPIVVASTTTGATSTTVTTSSAATTLVVTGHGFGHGMGMGQWGAYGYALHGWSCARILGHYFPGTALVRNGAPLVRVLLIDAVPKVTLGSAAPWRVVDGAGTRLALPAGSLDVPASLELDGQKLVSPLTFKRGESPVEAAGLPYRGKLVLTSDGKSIQLLNVVALESYLPGVVSEEMPSTWPQAALQAQAIAARSYALAQIGSVPDTSPFDLYADSRSQVYGGINAETPAVTKAVIATKNQVVLYRGKVATTYFSASSGGETMSAEEGTGTPVPYLVAVPDPYDLLSPYHDWGPVLLSAAEAAKALGLHGGLDDVVSTLDPTGRVASATVVSGGSTVTLTGMQVRDDLGLRSSWFQIGLLALDPMRTQVTKGTLITLRGAVRGLDGVSLEAQAPNGSWVTVSTVAPGGDGTFTVAVTPNATTRYRLSTGSVRGALIKVLVKSA
jgi:stage II sporulation protein D